MLGLRRKRDRELFIQRKEREVKMNLYFEAFDEWKFYTRKMKEYKKDKITRKFVNFQNAIIARDQPG